MVPKQKIIPIYFMRLRVIVFLILVAIIIKPFKVLAQVVSQDSLALVDLYNSTNGANWTNKTNWLTTSPVSAWHGVQVGNGRVTGLTLTANKLNGTIPSSLGNLTALVFLELDQNNLTGNIPSSLGNLTSLFEFYLDENNLSGTIPSSLGNLSQLTDFNLASNLLSGPVPSSLGIFKNAFVSIANNELTFTGMESVEQQYNASRYDEYVIDAYFSPQANIPISRNGNILSVSAGGTITNNTFNWYQNGTLVSTKTGDSTFTVPVNGNYSVAVTNSIVPLTLMSDTLSADVYTLPADSLALVALYDSTGAGWTTHTNWLTTSPVSTWYGVTVENGRVVKLILNSNNLINHVIVSLGNLTALDTLELSGNKLSNSLPASLSSLTKLAYLDVSNNKITGNVPAYFSSFTNLYYLNLSSNLFTGNIPSSFSTLTKLQNFDVSNNNLSGAISSLIDNIKSLQVFNLYGNQFTFAGMEGLATAYDFADYDPQAVIPIIKQQAVH
jgi:Leucine-rich repeat (LRR) protein